MLESPYARLLVKVVTKAGTAFVKMRIKFPRTDKTRCVTDYSIMLRLPVQRKGGGGENVTQGYLLHGLILKPSSFTYFYSYKGGVFSHITFSLSKFWDSAIILAMTFLHLASRNTLLVLTRIDETFSLMSSRVQIGLLCTAVHEIKE